jgi:hypothetical protein
MVPLKKPGKRSLIITTVAIFLFVIVGIYLYQQRTYSFSSTGEGVYLSKNSLNQVLGNISTYVSYNMSQQAPAETLPGGFVFTNLSTMKSRLVSEGINDNITAGWITAAYGQDKSSVYFVVLKSRNSLALSQQLANGTYSAARQINSASTGFDYGSGQVTSFNYTYMAIIQNGEITGVDLVGSRGNYVVVGAFKPANLYTYNENTSGIVKDGASLMSSIISSDIS